MTGLHLLYLPHAYSFMPVYPLLLVKVITLTHL
jgi:hypothetical protein